MWVKICGNTSLEDAALAADAGADAVGFIFAPSPRQVTLPQVAAITAHLPAQLEKIGVFVEPDLAGILAAVEACGLTGVQLHGAAESYPSAGEIVEELRARFGAGLRILEVIHFGEQAASQLLRASANTAVDGILIDSRTADALGGTGIAYDWQAARNSLFNGQSSRKLIVAGGLHPGNVGEAIATLEPWGVDVVSGVEAAPGRKDPEKVRAFVSAARKG